MDNVYTSGQTFRGEETRALLPRTPGGPLEEAYFDFACQPLFEPDRRPLGIFVHATDVTARVRGRRALDEARRSNDLLLTHAPLLLCAADADGRFVRMNPASSVMLGYAPEEMVGRPYTDFVLDEDRAATADAGERALRGEEIFGFENQYRHRDGTPVRLSWWAVWDAEEQLLLGVAQDLTQQRQQEQRLRESEEALHQAAAEMGALAVQQRAILSQITEGLIFTDAEGRITFVNDVAYQLHGVNQLDVGPDTDADAYQLLTREGAPYPPQALPLARALARSETVVDAEWQIQRPDGSRILVQGSAAPVRADDGTKIGAVLTLRDVTALRQQEEDVRQLMREQAAREAAEAQAEVLRVTAAELVRSNRELQDFAYVASHDLQEPLRKIQTFAGLLATSPGVTLDDEGQHMVNRVQAAAERMSGLIRDLLAFSRVSTAQRATPQPVDLGACLASVLTDLEVRLRETGGRVEADGPLPALRADPLLTRQLLLNLIGNALKFHRNGVPPVVRVSGRRLPNAVELVVEDNGIGFDNRYAERMFTPFQRLHAPHVYEGTGMGLAIVRRIVEQHGGQIIATGSPGEGAHFAITLPQP